MKNKKYLLLASVALLAGCGGNTSSPDIVTSATEDDSSIVSSESEIGTSSKAETSSTEASVASSKKEEESSVTSSVVVTDKLEALFGNLDGGRAKVQNKYGTSSSYFTMEFYGEDGYFFTGNQSNYQNLTGGVLNIPDKGVWKVVKDDSDALVLDSLYSVANTTDWTAVDTEYTGFYESFQALLDSEDLWQENGNTYTVDEESAEAAEFLDLIPGLARYLDGYSYGNKGSFEANEEHTVIAENVAMTIDSTGTSANITFDARVYKSGSRTKNYWSGKLVVTADGSFDTPTEMTALQAAGVPNLTAWPTDVQNAYNALLGEQVPFVTGISGAASFTMPDSSTIFMQDPFSGDLTNAFATEMAKTAMTDKGWAQTVAPTVVKTGLTQALYERTVSAETDASVGVSNQIVTSFFSASYFDGTTAAGMYPNGVFAISASHTLGTPKNINQINSYMDALVKKADGTSAVPALNFGSTTLESISFSDLTADMSEAYSQYYQQDIQFTCYYEIVGKCATDADATTAVSTWLGDLATAGFANLDDAAATLAATWESEGVINAGLADTNFTIFQEGLIIMVNLGQYDTTSKQYVTGSGYFEITIFA